MNSLDDTEVTLATGAENGPRESRPIEPGDVVGRFSIVSEIGRGGMGRIFEAQDPNLQRRVALKVLHEHGSDTHRLRLVREAQALARLEHPNVVTVHEVGTHEGAVFIAMELVTGGTLSDWNDEHPPDGRLHQEEALRLIVEAGRGLLAAHRAGLVHRDIKPSNILLGADGRARVADFGIVRSVPDVEIEVAAAKLEPSQQLYDSQSGTLTSTGASVGTPAYMAPEQFGAGEVGEAADQFSLCVTAWETLWGVRPFRGDTVGELFGKIRDGQPRVPDAVLAPESLVSVLSKGLRLHPRDRHASLEILLDKLAEFADPPKPAANRHGRKVIIGVGLLAVSASVLAYRGGAKADPCASSEDRFAEIWNTDRSTKLASVEPGYDGWPALESELDDYGTRWTAAYDRACEVALVRKEQSEPQMKERQACLELEREQLDALLRDASKDGQLSGLSDGLRALRDPSDCDLGLGQEIALPPDEHESLESARLAASRGRVSESLQQLDALVGRGRLSPGGELHEMVVRGAAVYRTLEDDGEAREQLMRAHRLAARQDNEALTVRSATLLAKLESRVDPKAAQQWLAVAESVAGSSAQHDRVLTEARLIIVFNQGGVEDKVRAVDGLLAEGSTHKRDRGLLLPAARVLAQEEIQLDRALRILSDVEALEDPEHADDDATSVSILRCAILSAQKSDEASAACEGALVESARAPNNQMLRARALGNNLRECGRAWRSRCEEVADSASVFVENVGTRPGARDLVAFELSSHLLLRGDLQRAKGLVAQSCGAEQATQVDVQGLARCSHYAVLLAMTGDLQQAQAEVAWIGRRLDAPRPASRELVVAHANLGHAHNLLDNGAKALEHTRAAAALPVGTPLEGGALHLRVEVGYCGELAASPDPQTAIGVCEAALKRARDQSDEDAAAGVMLNLGVAYFNSGRLEDATAAYEDAVANLRVGPAIGRKMLAVARANLAEVLEVRGDLEEAARRYAEAFERCEPTWSTYYFAGTGLVRVLARRGEFTRAGATLAQLRDAAPAMATLPRAQIAEASAVVEAHRGKTRPSSRSYARAVDLYTLAGAEDDVRRICAEVSPAPDTCP